MITVFYAKVFSHLEENTFLSYLNKVEEGRRQKILRLKEEKEKMRSLSAGCLLHSVLCENLGISCEDSKPFHIKYLENGKPYLPDRKEVNFNLSHSGDYVCCAIGEGPVGVDLQKKAEVKDGIAKRFFTQEDNQKLSECSGKEKQDLFFRMWSIKESYVKFTGLGMAKGLAGFEINFDRNAIYEKGSEKPSAYFAEWENLDGYSLSVCFEKPGQVVEWKNICEVKALEERLWNL